MSLINNVNHNSSSSSTIKNVSKQQHQLTGHYPCLDTVYDIEHRALWCTFRSSKFPVFSVEFLESIRSMQDTVAQYSLEHPTSKPLYLIWASDNSRIFSLGLDIRYVHSLISSKDTNSLFKYLELCIDILYINIMKFDIHPLITFSLIKGKTLGGGFEAALTSDIIFAGDNSHCAFPGLRYHLLPSIGLMNGLMLRYPKDIIEPLLFGHKRFLDAKELVTAGIAEKIISGEEGHKMVREKILLLNDKHQIYDAIYQAKSLAMYLKQKDLEEFKNLWVKTALSLKPDDLHRLSRIADAQELLAKRAFHR